jgi:hypothetical protein
MKNIIMPNGQSIPLATWQDLQGLPAEFISTNILLNSSAVWGYFEISSYVIEILNALNSNGFYVINSLYRTDAKQKDLIREGNPNAAKVSPHCFGMAADVDAKNKEQTVELAALIQEIATELNIKVRIGFNKYLLNGNTFVHFDVCPEYYAEGKPYHNNSHPKQWESVMQW